MVSVKSSVLNDITPCVPVKAKLFFGCLPLDQAAMCPRRYLFDKNAPFNLLHFHRLSSLICSESKSASFGSVFLTCDGYDIAL